MSARHVEVVCFANTCRSPAAATMLQNFLTGSDIAVLSSGLAGGPGTLPAALEEALAERSLVLRAPAGAVFDPRAARISDVVLFADRGLLRDAVVREPSLWPSSFTIREFARRGWLNPPDPTTETFEQWRQHLHSLRDRRELLGTSTEDDVADPGLGGTVADYRQMLAELEPLMRRIASLLSAWSS
jgi:protein-tyrosine-phosphatase